MIMIDGFLILIFDYVLCSFLNVLAFSKILKKYDKVSFEIFELRFFEGFI
jgi:hypothetical protein